MWSFLCPNGTIFNQEIFTCVWWFDFDCDTAAGLYDLNDSLYEAAPEGQQRQPARQRPQQPRPAGPLAPAAAVPRMNSA